MIAHARRRGLRHWASVLLAFIGLWMGHTLEYLRVWGTAGLVELDDQPGPRIHAASGCGTRRPRRALRVSGCVARGRRSTIAWTRRRPGSRRMWRGTSVTRSLLHTAAGVTESPGSRHLVPARGGADRAVPDPGEHRGIARAQPAPGIGAITGIHWAAPFVHLYVCAAACMRDPHLPDFGSIAERSLWNVSKRWFGRRSDEFADPATGPLPARRRAPAPLDGLGRHLWRRPPPLLLDV